MAKSQEAARVGKTRWPMKRIYHIHEAVSEGRFPNCSTLAAELEVTAKTIQRDVTFMRDRLGLPLEYDEQAHGYCYTGDVSTFPVFEVGAEELAGLFLARQAIESVRGTQLEKTMREVFARLTKTDLKTFGRLAEAVLKHREVEFGYRKLGSDKTERRRIQPYHLGEVDHCWYVIGFDHARKALRTFALPRIRALKVRKERFEVPDDFDGVAYLGSSFGVWTDPERPDFKQEVRIELGGYAARLAQERRWHPSQQITALNANASRVEVRFEVGRLEELVRWTLSWGGQAKVRAPQGLRKRVADEAARIQKGD